MPTQPPRPLAGLKVVEMGALIAGPFCAKILAEFGADVVKLEPPGAWRPAAQMAIHEGRHVGVVARAVAQQAIGLPSTCAKPEGQAIARALEERADIVVENFRPGTLEAWGMDYESRSPRSIPD